MSTLTLYAITCDTPMCRAKLIGRLAEGIETLRARAERDGWKTGPARDRCPRHAPVAPEPEPKEAA